MHRRVTYPCSILLSSYISLRIIELSLNYKHVLQTLPLSYISHYAICDTAILSVEWRNAQGGVKHNQFYSEFK